MPVERDRDDEPEDKPKDTEGQAFKFRREDEPEDAEEAAQDDDDTEGHIRRLSDARLKASVAPTEGVGLLARL